MTPMPPGLASIVDASSFQQRIAMRRDNSQDQPEECQVCSFETEYLKAFECSPAATVPTTTHNWMCELCANTLTGSFEDYPQLHPELSTMKTICHVGNVILAEIRKGRDLK